MRLFDFLRPRRPEPLEPMIVDVEPPIPLEVCRECGCTDELACPGGCFWVGAGLCSRCVAGFGGTD